MPNLWAKVGQIPLISIYHILYSVFSLYKMLHVILALPVFVSPFDVYLLIIS